VKLSRWHYECGHCGQDYELPNADLSFTYGLLIARSRGAEVALFDSFADPCFDEIRALVDGDPRVRSLTADQRIRLLHQVLSITFDPDRFGEPFVLTESPGCPRCGSSSVASFAETDVTISQDMAQLTHTWWEALTRTEKNARVHDHLDRLLDGA
jgi:hypothetical protein